MARFATFGAVVLATVLRRPELIGHPRFWAEGGTVYFQHALDHPWYSSLFRAHLGYYGLFQNLAAQIAELAPLDRAALAGTLMSLAAQLVPVSIVVWMPSRLWNDWPRRLLVLAGLLVLAEGELWLNIPNTQFHMATGAFLLLLVPTGQLGGTRRWLSRGVQGLAALTGPVASFLLPAFLVHARTERSHERLVQAGILGMGALLQVAVFVWAAEHAGRLQEFNPKIFVQNILLFSLIYPFVHPELILTHRTLFFLLTAIVGTLCTIVLWRAWFREGMKPVVIAFLAVCSLSMVGSLDMVGGHRYFHLPRIALLIVFIRVAFASGRATPRVAAALLLVWMLAYNGVRYRSALDAWYDPGWPSWAEEVDRWRHDAAYDPRVWPLWGPELRVRVPPRIREADPSSPSPPARPAGRGAPPAAS